ncbi:pantothenate transporter liz1 [Moniliophthora roreri MCA 2997]|uniref:Pantothenate transporter liz1 n=1 Tax=Moniliophthora roreri (strain MCA 2997) TaxID=1381753 RepID=V2W506_MONRO|nr:pantothenate transporter liz1 [Moniliophthora roreri MCA 2997]
MGIMGGGMEVAMNGGLQLGGKLGITEEEKQLPVIAAPQDPKHIHRARLVLVWILHFYVHTLPPQPDSEPARNPPSLSVPLLQISKATDQPPVLTYADEVILNSYLGTTDNEPKCLFLFNKGPGSAHEQAFYLTSARVEWEGAKAMQVVHDIVTSSADTVTRNRRFFTSLAIHPALFIRTSSHVHCHHEPVMIGVGHRVGIIARQHNNHYRGKTSLGSRVKMTIQPLSSPPSIQARRCSPKLTWGQEHGVCATGYGRLIRTTIMDSEKPIVSSDSGSDKEAASLYNAHVDISGVDERKLIRNIDLALIPWLSFLYLLSFLDRTSIGNAKLYHLEEDLGLNDNQYLISLTVFFFSYAVFEVPSNIFLKRLRPSIWLSGLMLLWGVMMTVQGLVHDYGGLVTMRFFLGTFEAGLFPGVTYYLSCWYKRSEFGIRAAVFFSAATVSGAFGGLLAAAIAQMDGVGGKPAWAWIL